MCTVCVISTYSRLDPCFSIAVPCLYVCKCTVCSSTLYPQGLECSPNVCVCVPACVCAQSCQFLMASDGLTIKRLSLWRLWLPVRCLLLSCSLPYCCQNLWQHSSQPKSSQFPASLSSSLSLPRLMLSFSCQLQPVSGIRSQGCRGNLSFPYHCTDHPWIVFPDTSNSPQHTHTKQTSSHVLLQQDFPSLRQISSCCIFSSSPLLPSSVSMYVCRQTG